MCEHATPGPQSPVAHEKTPVEDVVHPVRAQMRPEHQSLGTEMLCRTEADEAISHRS